MMSLIVSHLHDIINDMTKITKSKSGFTLIELLVVVSIITLLSSIVFSALSKARSKARDARRVSDMHQIQTALELYLDGHNGSYPASPASQNLADIPAIGRIASTTDPLTGQSYKYIAVAANNTICTSEPCKGYAIIANNENPIAANTQIVITSGTSTTAYLSSNVVATNVDYSPVTSGSGATSTAPSYSNLSGATSSMAYFTYDIPAGVDGATFQLTGGTGDADLYVKFGADPTLSDSICSSGNYGNEESCPITSPAPGVWHVMIYGYNAYSGVTLSLTYGAIPPPPPPPPPVATSTQILLSYLQHAAYVNGSFVAVNEADYSKQYSLTSTDGINWKAWIATSSDACMNGATREFAYGPNLVHLPGGVCGAPAGQEELFGTDGINWTSGPRLAQGSWDPGVVRYLNGKFMGISRTAFGQSNDLNSWATSTIPEDSLGWTGIAANGTNLVAVHKGYVTSGASGYAGARFNGSTWSRLLVPNPLGNAAWYGLVDVAYVPFAGGGKYVAIGQSSDYLTSADGVTWATSTFSGVQANGNYSKLAVFNNRLFAIGGGWNSNFPSVIYTDDGVTWNSADSAVSSASSWADLVCAPAGCMVSGWSGVAFTANGSTWNVASSTNVTMGP